MGELDPRRKKDRQAIQILEKAAHKSIKKPEHVTVNPRADNSLRHLVELYGLDPAEERQFLRCSNCNLTMETGFESCPNCNAETEELVAKKNKPYEILDLLLKFEREDDWSALFNDISPENRLISTEGIEGHIEYDG